MIKIAICLFSILFSTLAFAKDNVAVDNRSIASAKVSAEYDEDYYVALKAFDDGLYDVSRMLLLDYLAKGKQASQSGFATYLLYQILMHENKFKEAEVEFRKLSKYNDERFDKRKMDNDEVFLATKLDCEAAHSLILSNMSEGRLNIYLGSKCKIDDFVVDKIAKGDNYSPDVLLATIDKVKANRNYMMKIYDELSKAERTGKVLNFYGQYFMVEKMNKEFWTLFNEYKDEDLVRLALDSYWDSQNYDKYASLFAKDVKKEYKLPSVAYCRMIEASNKSSLQFDCNIIDNCLGTKSPEFKKTKLACFMKNEDKAGLEKFMTQVNEAEAANLCEYGRYIVGKKLYSINFIGKFTNCTDKASMYDNLIEFNDAASLQRLIGKPRGELDTAYLAIYEDMVGNKASFKKLMDSLTDKTYIDLVNSKINKKAK